MITFSNGHRFKYMVASGALGFDGKGWFWERPLLWLGLIKPRLFTVVLRTLTLKPRPYPVSNLSWIRPWTWLPWSPWSCVRFLKGGGAVNKVGLYNQGFHHWREKVAPTIQFRKAPTVVSIFGTTVELVEMVHDLDQYDLAAIECNVSCPNADHASETDIIITTIRIVARESRHPVIVKVNVCQDYRAIARGLEGVAQAISLNTVPWHIVFPNEETPLKHLDTKGPGGGGVSGVPAQPSNWAAVSVLVQQGSLPVIAPGIMKYDDIDHVLLFLRAGAASFGTIHMRTPCAPTAMVQKHKKIVPKA